MSERLDRLQREIAAEKAAALADLGLAFDGVVLVRGDQTVTEVIAARLERVPQMLRDDAESQLRRRVVLMPWLRARRVTAETFSSELYRERS